VPNGTGKQPTYRVADLSNPILQPWLITSMKKANDEVLAGKVPFRARERCWPVGIQHAVALPPEEVVIHRAAWRKILGEIAPLTTGAQNIHQAVYHRTHVGAALAAARPRRRNEWRNNRPLLVREVAWVPQMITIVSRPVFLCPHRRLSPTNQTTSFETQMISNRRSGSKQRRRDQHRRTCFDTGRGRGQLL
jgi:hypothetical protein